MFIYIILFYSLLRLSCELLLAPIYVATTIIDSLVLDRVYQPCIVTILRIATWVCLIIVGLVVFNMVLDIGCLSPYHTIAGCFA